MAYSLDALFSKVLKASITNNEEEGNYKSVMDSFISRMGMGISGYAYQTPYNFP